VVTVQFLDHRAHSYYMVFMHRCGAKRQHWVPPFTSRWQLSIRTQMHLKQYGFIYKKFCLSWS